ncbi:hypothetical protein J0H58_17075 [bacterium]|nr:hypothetical protein [bacterium]
MYAEPAGQLRVYFVERVGPPRVGLRLAGLPLSVVALPMAPTRREPGLDRGNWLVMTFHVSDTNGTRAIPEAVRVARRLGSRVAVGVRPCFYQEEADTWAGGWGDDPNTPLWLVLRDGQEVRRERGPLTADDIERLTRDALGR